MNNIRLIATIVAKENHENEVLSACKAMIKPSHKDEGCIQYELHKDTTQPRTFIFFEIWKDQNAIDKHNETEHMKAFVENLKDKIELLDIKFIEKLA
ncbi:MULTISPECIES: putative quinol monooxygenase [Enterobacterales]|uniref:putative quinol monooxygenase n=1 Tax=Enterobacterales TaxID=91347 RepID=UPI000847DD2C|nr:MULTISPECIES: putative quinol monooxygenase [Enterobacterales]WOO48788.1 putative quinol monooxygenase [Hafnia alvei]MCK9782880.1 antibiotic biosynthesis monooxygenase [Proteus columbae]MCT6518867.1 antibiotic biosynthesis monooxygenase [Proteus vulgaris]ODQ07039.1 antibiotic biosynthesis monooxygenase [Shigella sp. FC130]OEI94434.1 antibiotic biosynthesis monooxygenase [Shigella sp. FC1655]